MEIVWLTLALVVVVGLAGYVVYESATSPFWAVWHFCWGTLGSALNLAGAICGAIRDAFAESVTTPPE